MKLNFREIKRLIGLVEDAQISEFSIEQEGMKIGIKKGLNGGPVEVVGSRDLVQGATPVPAAPGASAGSAVSAASSESEETDPSLETLKAEMVGTFYGAPNPDAAVYVKVGDRVQAGQVVCIIEAMKLFNEIESDYTGTIEKICLQSGSPVEYGQDLFVIRTE